MNNRPKRICNRATASLEQLEKVIGDLQKKIQTQGEELGRKDARIKELKDELWELKHPKTTIVGPITTDGPSEQLVTVQTITEGDTNEVTEGL